MLCHVSEREASAAPRCGTSNLLRIPLLPSASSLVPELTWLHFNIREPFPRGEPNPQLINCMEQSSWEATTHLICKKFHKFYGTRRFITVFTRACNLYRTYSEHNQSTLHKHFNIILSSTPRSFKSSLSLRFPQRNPICPSPIPMHATCPAYLVLFVLSIRMTYGEEYRFWTSSVMQFPPVPLYLVRLEPPSGTGLRSFHASKSSVTVRS